MSDDARGERTEERYFQILDTAPDAMVVVRRDGTIAFVNLQTERVFGYARSGLLGKSLGVLLPERFREAHTRHVARRNACVTMTRDCEAMSHRFV